MLEQIVDRALCHGRPHGELRRQVQLAFVALEVVQGAGRVAHLSADVRGSLTARTHATPGPVRYRPA